VGRWMLRLCLEILAVLCVAIVTGWTCEHVAETIDTRLRESWCLWAGTDSISKEHGRLQS
jgi:hypothetical protein